MFTKNALRSRMLWVIAMVILSLSQGIAVRAAVIPPKDIPELSLWKSNMGTFGKQYCGSTVFDDTNFDAARVYYQMEAYTSLPDWATCANQAAVLYRSEVKRTLGKLDDRGEFVFSQGLKKHFLRTSEGDSRDAVVLLAEKSPWADSSVPLTQTQGYDMSREVALAIMAYLDSKSLDELAGTTRLLPKYDGFVTQALGHIDQWYVQRLWEQVGSPMPHVPFMVGLTMQALIQVYSYEQAHGASTARLNGIRDKIKVALDGLWNTSWVASEEAFNFINSADQVSLPPDPTYNLLIAPAYAWYYLEGGSDAPNATEYRDRADQIFAGGVRRAVLDDATKFNGNYMWSFQYVGWRQEANDKFSVPSTPPPSLNKPPVCDKAKAVPSMLWPPNHKLVAVRIGGVTDPDGDPISIGTNLPIKQNEPEKGLSRRDRHPDSLVQPDGTLYLRAERSRHGHGREYTISFDAFDGKGGSCAGTVKVTVPHQKSKLERFDDDDDDRDHDDGDRHGDRHGDKDKGKDKDKRHDGDKRDR